LLLSASLLHGRASGADRLHEIVPLHASSGQRHFRKAPKCDALADMVAHKSQPPALDAAGPDFEIEAACVMHCVTADARLERENSFIGELHKPIGLRIGLRAQIPAYKFNLRMG